MEKLSSLTVVGVLRSIYPRNCALFEESMKVSMDKLCVILNKFRGGHKWNMQLIVRGTSFQNGYQRHRIALIMANDEDTDTSIFRLLKVKIYFTVCQIYSLHMESHNLGVGGGKGILGSKNFFSVWTVAIRLHVRPSVRHAPALYQNYSSYDRVVFTGG